MNRSFKIWIAGCLLLSLLASCGSSRRHPPKKYRKRAPCDCPVFGQRFPVAACYVEQMS
ncbi:MAG: hypothetical protein LBF89_01755 [Bacteroidales bacterium]|nr:hypothetical protein [Bacteroidales bacterium]